ncbi:hypothetical protein [Sphingomonas sp.]|uniref:hypothetical protein n=1 Tax=Sphingomonas sp. TaxID=28214 RepID=UPI003BAB2524
MAGDKQLFAPMPLRAMAADMSGLQLRVLLCVAAHDRLSLVTGKGQGCRASNDRMSAMIGCSYGKLCAALSSLTDAGFLQREKLGRHTVYRIIYSDDDKCLFGHTSRAATCDQTVQREAATCDRDFRQSSETATETPSQYIPLNGGIHSVETGEYNSPEGARLTSRDSASNRNALAVEAERLGRKALHRDGEPLHETLAKFERQWKKDWTAYRGKLVEWRDWLADQSEFAASEGDGVLSAWAMRLSETVDYLGWEVGEIVEAAA